MKSSKIHIELASQDSCTGCAACAQVCPKGCISMMEDREGFLQPKIDTKLCIGCHKCEKTCPILNKETIPTDFVTKAYAVINPDEEIRMQSSSGGVFYALAKWVIEQGGVVFGARWDENWMVMHDYTEDLEGVKAFMQSKYVQSRVGDTYKQVKDFLMQNRWVLYSGTPCQLGGLRAYLGKGYEKLLQVDLICHGVPSPGVWRKYLVSISKKDEIQYVCFRDKTNGWDSGQMIRIDTNTTLYRKPQLEDSFFYGFVKDVFSRKSCFDCQFRGLHRETDLTLSDFWGVKDVRPDLYNVQGVTLVYVHSPKALGVLPALDLPMNQLSPKDFEGAVEHNPSITTNWKEPKNRKLYFAHYKLLGFKTCEPIIYRKLIYPRILRKIKKIGKITGFKRQ